MKLFVGAVMLMVGLGCFGYEIYFYQEHGDVLHVLSILGAAYIFFGVRMFWMAIPGDDETIVKSLLEKLRKEKRTVTKNGGTYSFLLPDASEVLVWKKNIEISTKLHTTSLSCSDDLKNEIFKYCVENTKEKQEQRKQKQELRNLLK